MRDFLTAVGVGIILGLACIGAATVALLLVKGRGA